MSRKKWTTEKLFHRLLNNKSGKTSWGNIVELRSRGTEEVFIKSYELAHSDTVKEKIIGINLLAQLGSEPRPFLEKTIELYFKLLEKETNPKVLSAVLGGIAHNNGNLTNEQILILVSFKNNKNQNIRECLVHSLLFINNDLAIDTLILLSNDKIIPIRDWATFGIAQIKQDSENIRNALWKRINDNDETTKFEAIVGLAKRQDPKIKAIIEQELLKEEFGTLLFEAIEELNDRDFIPLLQKSLEINKNDKDVSESWLNDLQECLDNLKKP